MTSAKAITTALRGSWRGNYGMIRCLIHADREPSCKITDDPRKSDGIDVHCFAGCEWRHIKAELRKAGLLDAFVADTSGHVPARPPEPEPEPDPQALEIWRSAAPIEGTLGEKYLTEHRGLAGPFPPSLRFAPSVLYPRAGLRLPALVAAVARTDRKLTALQVTFLDAAGRKSTVTTPRWTIGKLRSGAVHLAPAADTLGLAEGVETALAAMRLTGIPVWATLGAKRLSRIEVPDTVRHLHLFRDNDEPGMEAGRQAAEHYSRLGLQVHLRNPPGQFDDYNAVVMTAKKESGAS